MSVTKYCLCARNLWRVKLPHPNSGDKFSGATRNVISDVEIPLLSASNIIFCFTPLIRKSKKRRRRAIDPAALAGVVSLDLIGMKAALCTSLAGQTLCVYLYLSTRLIFKTAQLTAQIKTHMHTEQHSIFLYIFPLKMSQHRRRVNKHKGERRERRAFICVGWSCVCPHQCPPSLDWNSIFYFVYTPRESIFDSLTATLAPGTQENHKYPDTSMWLNEQRRFYPVLKLIEERCFEM